VIFISCILLSSWYTVGIIRTQHVFTRDATPRHRLVATVYCELYVRPIYADRLDGSTAPQISAYISCHQQPQQRTRASQQVTLSPYRYIGNQMHTCRPRQSSACHAAAPSAAYRTIAYRTLFQQTLRPYFTMYDHRSVTYTDRVCSDRVLSDSVYIRLGTRSSWMVFVRNKYPTATTGNLFRG